MSIDSAIKGKVISVIINKIKASEPVTTGLGAVLAGIVAAQIDYGKLLQGDPVQIGNAVAAVVVALMGWYTNHKSATSPVPPVPGGPDAQ